MNFLNHFFYWKKPLFTRAIDIINYGLAYLLTVRNQSCLIKLIQKICKDYNQTDNKNEIKCYIRHTTLVPSSIDSKQTLSWLTSTATVFTILNGWELNPETIRPLVVNTLIECLDTMKANEYKPPSDPIIEESWVYDGEDRPDFTLFGYELIFKTLKYFFQTIFITHSQILKRVDFMTLSTNLEQLFCTKKINSNIGGYLTEDLDQN